MIATMSPSCIAPPVPTATRWGIRDPLHGGHAMQGENGWGWTWDLTRATTFDNEPSAYLAGIAAFPTIDVEIVKL